MYKETTQSTDLLEVIFENTHTHIAYLDRDLNFLRVNKSYAAADGKDPEYFIGKGHFDLFPNEENEAIFRCVAETGEPHFSYAKSFEYEHNPERGVTHWDWSLVPVKGKSGSVDSLILQLINVTERIKTEEKLLLEEHLGNAFVNSTTALMVMLDKAGRIVRFNRACEDVTQYKSDEVLGKYIWDMLLMPEEIDPVMGVFQSLTEKALPSEFTNCWVAKDGSKRKIQWSNNVLKNEQNNVQYVISVGVDVTDRELAQNALRHSKEELDRIFYLMPDIIGYGTLEGVFTRVNEALHKILGYRDEEFLHEQYLSFIHPDDISATTDALNSAQQGISRFDIDNRYRCKDGSYKWIAWSVVSDVSKNEFLAVGRNTNEKKLAEKALLESEARLNYLVNNSLATIYTCAAIPPFGATYISPNVSKTLGYEPEEFTENENFWIENIHPEDQQRIIDNLPQLFEHGVHKHEYRFRDSEGNYRWLYDELLLVKDESNVPIEFIGYWADITERKKVEENLWLKDFAIDSSINAIAIASLEGKLTYVNQAFADIWKLPDKDSAIGRSPLEFWEDQNEAHNVVEMLSKNGQWQGELRAIRDDGTTFDLQLSANLVKAEDNKPICMMSSFVDISAQKRVERELQAERDFATSLINTAPVIILLLDLKGLIQHVNPYFEEITGYKLDEIKGKNWFSLFLPEYEQDRIQALFSSAIKGGQTTGDINSILTRSGEKREIEWYDQLMKNIAGITVGLLAIGLDVTSRRESENAVVLSEYRLNEAQRIAKVGNWELDLQRDTLFWSDEIYRIFEIDKENFGASYEAFLEAIHPDDRNMVSKAYSDSLINQTPYGIDHRLLMKDGSIKYVHENCKTIFNNNGKPIRSLGTVQDITRQKIAEIELNAYREHLEEMVEERAIKLRNIQDELVRKERLATLGQLTATVSHELRNPLSTMRPSLYIIDKNSNKEDQYVQAAIGRLDRSIGRCDHIIDELLDFTRITKLELCSVKLDDWLGGVIDEQDIPAGITVEKIFSLNNIELNIDVSRLRRAVINLVENACHSMLDEEKNIKVKSCLRIETRKKKERIEIIVKDTGIGIADDVMDRIYEPLYSTKGFGVGLGMSIVKQIMEQHNGGIEITTSTYNRSGTTVTLWLPLMLNYDIE